MPHGCQLVSIRQLWFRAFVTPSGDVERPWSVCINGGDPVLCRSIDVGSAKVVLTRRQELIKGDGNSAPYSQVGDRYVLREPIIEICAEWYSELPGDRIAFGWDSELEAVQPVYQEATGLMPNAKIIDPIEMSY